MNTQEILKYIDEVLKTKNKPLLNDLQREVITGILEGKKYPQIAKSSDRSPNHVKDVGYKLLNLLSEIFDEKVNKKNIKSVLERQGNFNINFGDNTNNINKMIGENINLCHNNSYSNLQENKNPNIENQHNQKQIEKINKLRQIGLSDEQIAEVLNLDNPENNLNN